MVHRQDSEYLTQYTARVVCDVAYEEVPSSPPRTLVDWVRPAVIDGSPWWSWGGREGEGAEHALQEWRVWRRSWCARFQGPTVAAVRWAGEVESEWAEVLGRAVDPARCATLLLSMGDVLTHGRGQEVATWSQGGVLRGYAVPGRAQVLLQDLEYELLLTPQQVLLWSIARGEAFPVNSWNSSLSNLEVNGAEQDRSIGRVLRELGGGTGCFQLGCDEFCTVSGREWAELGRGLLFAVNNFKYAKVHTLA